MQATSLGEGRMRGRKSGEGKEGWGGEARVGSKGTILNDKKKEMGRRKQCGK